MVIKVNIKYLECDPITFEQPLSKNNWKYKHILKIHLIYFAIRGRRIHGDFELYQKCLGKEILMKVSRKVYIYVKN